MNNKADLLKKTELKKVKPFPKFVISLLLLLVVVGLGYFLCLQPSTDQLTHRYETFGQFICKYDIALICFILVMNVIELIDFAINAKRDEAINANYEAMLGHIHLLGFFKQYFAPLFAKGPFIFASEEEKVAAPRKIIHLVVGTIKWLYWLVFILLFIAMMSKPEFKTVILEGNRDYIFTAFVLFYVQTVILFYMHFIKYLLYILLELMKLLRIIRMEQQKEKQNHKVTLSQCFFFRLRFISSLAFFTS